MTLKCNICSFTAAEKIGKQKIHTEQNMRKHIREKHGDMLPKSTVYIGAFFKKNIIYEKARVFKSLNQKSWFKRLIIDQIFRINQQLNLNPAKDKEATRSTPKKAKKRGTETGSVSIKQYFLASPALSAKKRRSARILVPEKPQKGNFDKKFRYIIRNNLFR